MTSPTATAAAPRQQPAPLPSLLDEYDLMPADLVPDVAAAPAPAPPPKPQHPARLARMAADFGIPQEEIDATPTGQLEGVVYHLHRQLLTLNQEHSRAAVQHQAREPNPSPAGVSLPPPAPAKAPGDDTDWGTDPETRQPYKESDYLPAVAASIKRTSTLEKRLAELENRLAQLGQLEHRRQQETLAERIDRQFAGLGMDELLGRGGRSALDPAGAEMQRRVAVLALVDRDQGQDPFEAKLGRAAQALFGARQAPTPPAPPEPPAPQRPAQPRAANGTFLSAEEQELARRQQVWNDRGLARPTQRAGGSEPGETPGYQKAVRSVETYMRENGQTAPPSIADEFPG